MSILDPGRIRDIAPLVLNAQGRVRVLPTAFWASTTLAERALFGHRHGIYSFPTTELVEYLQSLIHDRPAIEIGAGHGVLAEALGIPATDNHMQLIPKYRAVYEGTGQPIVKYGPDVQNLDAAAAVRRFEPNVIIGCWVTHKYDEQRHWAGGNEIGVDEEDVLAHCAQYVVVGNDKVHAGKKIWEQPHERLRRDFVFSRATNGSPDFIAIWPGAHAGTS